MSERAAVTRDTVFLDPYCRRVHGTWSYTLDDPLAVSLVLHPAGGSATRVWSWARALLAAAFVAPSGDADVHLYRSTLERMVLRLSAPDGDCLLSCLAEPVWEFLVSTCVMCAPCRSGQCGSCPECALVRQALDAELVGILRGAVS
ncbi:MAG: SsgA family sporulation/cell division regulator [Pseudonocardiaceae bacterium]